MAEFELFFVQAWLIWNQRNVLNHVGKLKDSTWLNRRAADCLDEFWQAQDLLQTPVISTGSQVWQPPPRSMFKLNFDATTFPSLNCSGLGAMICNEKGEVMAALLARGPPMANSEEAKTIVCRKVLESAIDARFFELVIEGDNKIVMTSISSASSNLSRIGHIVNDIQCLAHGLHWVQFS